MFVLVFHFVGDTKAEGIDELTEDVTFGVTIGEELVAETEYIVESLGEGRNDTRGDRGRDVDGARGTGRLLRRGLCAADNLVGLPIGLLTLD